MEQFLNRYILIEWSNYKMAPLFKLSPDETLRLVQEYKKHELLYNKNHELYKNTLARRSALKFIGDVLQLNKSVNEINRKIKSLRSTFILEQNKILGDTEYIPKLLWYNEMASFVPFTPTGKSRICTDEQSIGGKLPPRHDATRRCLKRLTVSRRCRGTPRKAAKRMVKPPMSVLLETESTDQSTQHHAASFHKTVRFEEPGNTSAADRELPDEAELSNIENESSEDEDLVVATVPVKNKKKLSTMEKGVSETRNTSFAASTEPHRSSIDQASEPEREATSQTSQTVPEYKILIKFAEFINATLRALDINVFLVIKSAIQQILNHHRLINLKEQDIDDANKQVLNQSMATELSCNNKAKASFKALVNNDDEYDAFTYEIVHQLILMSKWSYLHAQTQIVSIIVTMRLNPWICKQSDSNPLVKVRDLMTKVHGQLQENDMFKAEQSKNRVVLREQSNSRKQGIVDAESATTPGEPHQEGRSGEVIVLMEENNSREEGILYAESTTPGEALYQEGRSREVIVPREQSTTSTGILSQEINTNGNYTPPGSLSNIRTPQLYSPLADFELYYL